MYDHFDRLASFDEVAVGQEFVERMMGKTLLYKRVMPGEDDQGTRYNSEAVRAGEGERAYFKDDDLVYVIGKAQA